ncbi:MAG: ATP-binding cassette domain-containing protein [Desulforhopalus sp.]
MFMIELFDIYKSFGSVQALQGVNLTAAAGTIHGIVGENGAGKSTLMKILTGFISRTGGDIRFDGRTVPLDSPKDASRLGIGMLYQEPLDFPRLSVLDNFMAGAVNFDPGTQRKQLAQFCKTFGFSLNPDNMVEELTVGERQQLELMRLIRDGANILILDEPTTGISENQQELLFSALQTLKNEGSTILLVSHKLEEIELLCDTVTVLRHGRAVATEQHPFNRDSLLQAMFDMVPGHQSPPTTKRDGLPMIEFNDVHSTVGRSGLKNVSISIRAGEVVGMAGIDGSGQSVFLKTAFGLLQPESGKVSRFGLPLKVSYGRKSRKTVFLPADRLTEGLFPGMTIRDHHLLSDYRNNFITNRSGLNRTRQAIDTYNIKGNPETLAEGLSGGNQQRLLLSLIPEDVQLILMENPTRGLDVQSAAWTWHHLHRCLQPGGAIVFASPDLEEIMEQATRILVFYNGNIVLDTPTHATNYRQLSRAITGQAD